MVVDPRVDDVNPEVCDACAGNCDNNWRAYFDSNNQFLGGSQDRPSTNPFPGSAYFTATLVSSNFTLGGSQSCIVDPRGNDLRDACVYSPLNTSRPQLQPLDTKPDISNLRGLIEDAKKAFLDNDMGPEDPTDYSELRGRLEASRNKFPPLYRKIDVEPYIRTLDELGEAGFISILLRDPTKERLAGLMLDIAQSILQNGEKYSEIALDAFEEVVSDLYDGFLSAEDRRGVNPPDKETIPPLVKFGNPGFGPYTFTVDATASFGCQTGIVSLPPSHTRLALIGWAAVGHEACGHDILHADTGMFEELTTAVQTALEQQGLKDGLPEYWSSRIDETASDCLGILNMGLRPLL